jgi:guanine nucleotide-binding protein alpha-1 subunit
VDVCKARLKTVGVSETNFRVERGVTGTGDWKVYDVGGSRTLRSTWVPFFDDGASARIFDSTMRLTSRSLSVNAILFLAPISAFDQRLEEDSRVYRIEDSMLLWREICRNKLLINVNLILFLNKVDLLQKKLESGIHLNKYLTQYKGPNTLADVCKCEWPVVPFAAGPVQRRKRELDGD